MLSDTDKEIVERFRRGEEDYDDRCAILRMIRNLSSNCDDFSLQLKHLQKGFERLIETSNQRHLELIHARRKLRDHD